MSILTRLFLRNSRRELILIKLAAYCAAVKLCSLLEIEGKGKTSGLRKRKKKTNVDESSGQKNIDVMYKGCTRNKFNWR